MVIHVSRPYQVDCYHQIVVLLPSAALTRSRYWSRHPANKVGQRWCRCTEPARTSPDCTVLVIDGPDYP
uniref:Laminin N-terminal domain-containing protein n=1 Tax=Macrostomum lignano TaxID=282301 RepID=A0A1I8F650_9PLAT